ncbi:hypothetical protein BYT27DRAFT_6533431 [Phlegmacium glaucopus]|nr:hypothetical protein BYT27DRAFT_6533431 [Phlegmacium glaucopus]
MDVCSLSLVSVLHRVSAMCVCNLMKLPFMVDYSHGLHSLEQPQNQIINQVPILTKPSSPSSLTTTYSLLLRRSAPLRTLIFFNA